jgi:tetratricopeptide (TPR) repeat protein
VSCHLPRTGSNFNHTSVSDHRIPRKADPASRPSGSPPWPKPGQIPLAPFHPNPNNEDQSEDARGLGIALMELADGQSEPRARQLADSALPLLEAALTAFPKDVPALDAQGDALLFKGRLEDALPVYESALKQAPEREVTLVRGAELALRLDRPALARTYWERALRVNPWRWQYHQSLARTLIQLKEWSAAAQECRASLRLQPTDALRMRQWLIIALLNAGDRDQARAEFAVLLGLSKADQEEGLRGWFAQLLKRTDG